MIWMGTLSFNRSCKEIPDSAANLACTWKAYLLETNAEKNEGIRGASAGRYAGTATLASQSM